MNMRPTLFIGFAFMVTACHHDTTEQMALAAAAANPFTEVEEPTPGEEHLRGEVTELARAGGYTYLRVTRGDGSDRWVVTLGHSVAVGDRVAVKNMGTRRDFRSRRLGRTFEELVFGMVRTEVEG